ncbi:hypothetical protein [Actinomadura welshii]|uniref:hypothetical protein n=1 Tax=Actinomadura welshii TaxID=3103817 RepID=UPI0003ACE51A|nr:hypothetical protein [Actinomadura madurae]
MIDDRETYVVPHTWRHPLSLALVALALVALCTGAALTVIWDGNIGPRQFAVVAAAFGVMCPAVVTLGRAGGAARRRLRREIAFSVTGKGVWLGTPVDLLIPWEQVAAIDVVHHRSREWTLLNFLDLPWRSQVSKGRYVYVHAALPRTGPPLARLEITGWRMRMDRLADAATHHKPAVRTAEIDALSDPQRMD